MVGRGLVEQGLWWALVFEVGLVTPQATSLLNYSITLSARTNNASGTVTSIALAVLRLITSSNLVGSSTGRSRGSGAP